MRATKVHKSAVAISAMAVAVLAAASFAWACTGAPAVTFRSAQSEASSSAGPAESSVALEGREWATGPVQVRWNSAVGEVLATPDGPSFIVTVQIPGTARPGVYTIFFVQEERVARVSYEVTPSDPPPPGGGGGGESAGGQSSASTSGAEGQQLGGGGRTAASTGGGAGAGAAASPGQGGVQTFASPTQSESTGSTVTSPEAVTPSATASASGPGAVPVAVRPGAVASAGNQTVFAGSVGAGSPASGGEALPVGAEEQASQGPNARVVSGDLYSGFDASGDASLLSGLADSARSSKGTLSEATLAVALFGVSLVALFGGFAAAEVRRRRVLARTS